MKKWIFGFRNVKIEEPGKENELCPVCGLPLNSCICEDEPVNPPVEYCEICGKPLSECKGHSSSDHGTGYCAECYYGDSADWSSAYHDKNLFSHGHKETEIFGWEFRLIFKPNNDNQIITLFEDHTITCGYIDDNGNYYNEIRPVGEVIPNGGKNSVFDFEWDVNRFIANEGTDNEIELQVSIKYDVNEQKWFLIFYDVLTDSEMANGKIYLEDCKYTVPWDDDEYVIESDYRSPLAMIGKTKDGTIQVQVNE